MTDTILWCVRGCPLVFFNTMMILSGPSASPGADANTNNSAAWHPHPSSFSGTRWERPRHNITGNIVLTVPPAPFCTLVWLHWLRR